MKRLLWIALFFAIGAQAALAQPVMADAVPPLLREFIPPEEGERIGRIVIENGLEQIGVPEQDTAYQIVVPTEWGDVTFDYVSTWNGRCVPACPDVVSVAETPPGYIVRPFELTIDEFDTGVFEMLRFEGM
ncbi:hypothetical protein [Thauera sp.]|uniref:hypothetical protein n=1 Tax=Thauera sp. TaxID=1905334 RepID=UPI002BC67697|nr:hypothetical protein [Thauera sp.]HRP25364.1 hypothetical protein [Thauera sp.]